MKIINNRRGKRIEKIKKDKELLQIEREVNELYKQKRAIPSIKLDRPIQNGYVRTLILRDDVARRRDAKDLERICAYLNHPMYCRRADFKAKKHGRKTLEEIPHTIPAISVRAWDKLNWPEHFKKYFWYGERIHTFEGGRTFVMKGYWLLNEWMFTTKVDKHFLTHVRQIDPDIESRIAKLEEKRDLHIGRLVTLHGQRGRMSSDWNRGEVYHKTYEKLINEQIKEFEDPHLNGNYDWT